MGYEVGSHPWGQGEDVSCAQDGVLGETRDHEAGSLLLRRGCPPCRHSSPRREVTLAEALCPGARPALQFASVAMLMPKVAPWLGHVGCGRWPHMGGSKHFAGGEQPLDTD